MGCLYITGSGALEMLPGCCAAVMSHLISRVGLGGLCRLGVSRDIDGFHCLSWCLVVLWCVIAKGLDVDAVSAFTF